MREVLRPIPRQAYEESYEVIRRLEEKGLVPPGVRFKAQHPTPLASIAGFIAPEDRAALEPSCERALFAAVTQFATLTVTGRPAATRFLPAGPC